MFIVCLPGRLGGDCCLRAVILMLLAGDLGLRLLLLLTVVNELWFTVWFCLRLI